MAGGLLQRFGGGLAKLRWLPIALCILWLAAGCALLGRGGGTGKEPVAKGLNLKTLTFEVDVGGNDNSPVRVELARVKDEGLASELVRLDSADWFEGEGEAFRRANPEAIFDAWEVVPGQRWGPFDVTVKRGFRARVLRRGKVAGVLFCDTLGNAAPLRVETNGHVTVFVGDDGCEIRPPPPKRSFLSRLRRTKTRTLTFAVAPESNGNRPVRVAFVGIKNEDVADQLAHLDGAAWFASAGAAFRREHPEAVYADWEVVPGGVHGPFEVALRGVVSGMLFCETPASAPLRFGRKWAKATTVAIDDDGCQLSDREPP